MFILLILHQYLLMQCNGLLAHWNRQNCSAGQCFSSQDLSKQFISQNGGSFFFGVVQFFLCSSISPHLLWGSVFYCGVFKPHNPTLERALHPRWFWQVSSWILTTASAQNVLNTPGTPLRISFLFYIKPKEIRLLCRGKIFLHNNQLTSVLGAM